MKKFYYLCLLTILPIFVFAESDELKTNQREFATKLLGLPVNAIESYQYYNDNGNNIKNGAYSYSINENFYNGDNTTLEISLKSTATFKDGLLNGSFRTEFYMDGILQGQTYKVNNVYTCNFKDGVFDGDMSLTRDNNQDEPQSINISFRDGHIDGDITCKNIDGFSFKGNISDNKLNGFCDFYNDKYKYEQNFINDILIYQFQKSKEDYSIINDNEFTSEMQEIAANYANNVITLAELNNLGYDTLNCQLNFDKINDHIFNGYDGLLFSDAELKGIKKDVADWSKTYLKLILFVNDEMFNSMLINFELIKGDIVNDTYNFEYQGKYLEHCNNKLWRWDDFKPYEFDDICNKYYITCTDNKKYYISNDKKFKIDSLTETCRNAYRIEQQKIQLENSKNLVMDQLNKLKNNDLSLSETNPSVKNFCPLLDFEIVSCVEDPNNNYLFNDNKFVYTCTINTKREEFQDSYHTYKTCAYVVKGKLLEEESFNWDKSEKIKNDWDKIIDLDKSIKNTDENIIAQASNICPDVLTAYQTFKQNYNLIPTKDTKESIDRLNKFIGIQTNCSQFIEYRDQFAKNDSIIISLKKECKPIFKLYSKYISNIDKTWTADNVAVTRMEEIVAIQNKLIRFMEIVTKDDFKLIRKNKIKDVQTLIDFFDLE